MSNNPIILITGANTGLGLEVIKALLQSPTTYTILLCGRSMAKAEGAVKEMKEAYPSSKTELVPMVVDIESDESIAAIAKEVQEKYGRVDILINNAGASYDHGYQNNSMSMRDAYNKTWDVNVTGTHIMTTTFIPLLFASSSPRIIFITSGTSSLNETELPEFRLNLAPPAGWPKDHTGIMNVTLYRSSKTGMNMMFREWVRLLRNDEKFKVFCISPGFLATNLNGSTPEQLKKAGALDPAIGGNFVKDVVEGKRDADAGKIMRKDSIQPW